MKLPIAVYPFLINLDKIDKSECGYDGNKNVSRKNPTRAAPLILYKLYPVIVTVLFIMQAMDASSLHVVLSIEFDLIPQLELNLSIESSNIATYCAAEMIHTVCVVFYNVVLFDFFVLFECENVILLTKYEIQ